MTSKSEFLGLVVSTSATGKMKRRLAGASRDRAVGHTWYLFYTSAWWGLEKVRKKGTPTPLLITQAIPHICHRHTAGVKKKLVSNCELKNGAGVKNEKIQISGMWVKNDPGQNWRRKKQISGMWVSPRMFWFGRILAACPNCALCTGSCYFRRFLKLIKINQSKISIHQTRNNRHSSYSAYHLKL